MPTQFVSIVVEAINVASLRAFWAEALGWEPVNGGLLPNAATLRGQRGLDLVFVPSSRVKTGKNRLHLDLAGDDREVARLLAAGAERADIGQHDIAWEVLADPEGNEFCVMTGKPHAGYPLTICLDVADTAVEGAFWQAATGWSIVDRGPWGIRLGPARPTGVSLVMGPPVAPKVGHNRLMPLLAADDLDVLRRAGAKPVEAALVDWPWPLLCDPEANEFAVVSRA